jgi:hypothetical protein
MSSGIDLTDEMLTVSNLRITNKDAVAFVRQIQEDERMSLIEKALEVGLFCLERGRNTQDIDFVKRQVQELLHKVEQAVGGVAGNTSDALLAKIGTDNGQVLAPVKAIVDSSSTLLTSRINEVKALLAQDLDPKSASSTLGMALTTVRTLLDPKHQDSIQSSLDKAVSSLSKSDGALADTVKRCVEDSIRPLKEEVDGLVKQLIGQSAADEALANSTAKGPDFEDRVETTLHSWAKVSRANINRVGQDKKPGDFTVEFRDEATDSTSLLVVIEARSRGDAVGKQAISQYLPNAFGQRSAHAAIYLSETISGLAKEIGDWAVGSCDQGPWVACTMENLILALRFLDIESKVKRLREFRSEVDSVLVSSSAEKIKVSLGRIRTIKTKATLLRTTTADIENEAEELRSEIGAALTSIESALRQERKGAASVDSAPFQSKPIIESNVA